MNLWHHLDSQASKSPLQIMLAALSSTDITCTLITHRILIAISVCVCVRVHANTCMYVCVSYVAVD